MENTNENLKRLNKFIGETGYCSRREADKLIEEGRVTINGIVPEMGTKVSPDDEVRIDGKLIVEKNEKSIYLAFNKKNYSLIVWTGFVIRHFNIIVFFIAPCH